MKKYEVQVYFDEFPTIYQLSDYKSAMAIYNHARRNHIFATIKEIEI